MKIIIGSDHRGFSLKEKIMNWFGENDISCVDFGANTFDENDDYVDYAKKVAENVSIDKELKGIIICGSGVGVDIVANKIKGARCGLGFDKTQIKMAREDDDINLLALPSDFLNKDQTIEIIKSFIYTEFKNQEKYNRRIEKIKDLENGI